MKNTKAVKVFIILSLIGIGIILNCTSLARIYLKFILNIHLKIPVFEEIRQELLFVSQYSNNYYVEEFIKDFRTIGFILTLISGFGILNELKKNYMAEKNWYYVKNNKQEGPIPESKMQEMFEAGLLSPETLVWSESMTEWTPASKEESFRVKTIPSPPPLPQKPPPIPSLGEAKKDEADAVSQVRPWVRYWARNFDYALFGLVVGVVFGVVAPSLLDIPETLLNMLIAFTWVFVEAFLLSTWGTTPGKWLLRTTLRDSAGNKLNFSMALNRSFSVWWRGIGIGFPIVTLITLIVAHGKLTKEGITDWDREGGFVVSHKKIGALRVIVMILFFIGFVLLIALGKTFEKSGW